MARTLRQMFDLSGRIALITGGCRGLGIQIAEALGEFGAQLVLVARKTGELDQAMAQLAALGISVRAIAADLRDPLAVGTLVEDVQAHEGQIDILVNNAGATWGAPAE